MAKFFRKNGKTFQNITQSWAQLRTFMLGTPFILKHDKTVYKKGIYTHS
jgi:hypothetical protein